MLDKDIGDSTLNFKAFYTKAAHVEELRDTYGIYLHAYTNLYKYLTFGGAFCGSLWLCHVLTL